MRELDEWINVVALASHVDTSDSPKLHQVQRLLARYRREGRRVGDFGIIRVTYVRKHGLRGRWYAKGPSIQSYCTKTARSVGLATEIGASAGADMLFVDVDINNCFVTLFVNALRNHGADMDHFRVLVSFCENYRAWREFLGEYLGISAKTSKKMLIRLVHLGRPADAIPFLWELAHQIQEAVDFLFELDRFQHLTARFMDRPNPRATRLHYALADLEEAVMTDLVETVQELPGCHFNTFMCDGAIIRVEEEGGVPGLRRELESIGARHGVTFSISTFDRLGGASRPKRKR